MKFLNLEPPYSELGPACPYFLTKQMPACSPQESSVVVYSRYFLHILTLSFNLLPYFSKASLKCWFLPEHQVLTTNME